LPWRNTRDPYKIWVSEIILQQTRVDQGLNYYLRFIDRFPDVATLASCDEEEVLKYWQGLGYYSRARNLHHAAQTIMTPYQGKFPDHYEDVIQLKGIGEYTASAILSFAWNQPYPTVDGNVFRVLSRFLAIDESIDTNRGKALFTQTARMLMGDSEPGLFNQAMMEFGAMQCVPIVPDCLRCPLKDQCMALSLSQVKKYPVKQQKTKIQSRYLYYFHIHYEGYTYLNKRVGKGIWQNLYEFPQVESETPLSFEDLTRTPLFQQLFAGQGKHAVFTLAVSQKKHVLTHRVLFADFYEVELGTSPEETIPFLKIKEEDLGEYPVHRLMQFYLERS